MQTVTVDDTDPRLVYSGNWETGGDVGEYNQTTHGGTSSGSSVTFKFDGTAVAVYGTVGSTPFNGIAHSTYQLDDMPPTQYKAPFSLFNQQNKRFYSSPQLDDKAHTLVIILNAHPATLWLDYLTFETSDPTQSTNSTTSPQLQSPTTQPPLDTTSTTPPASAKTPSTPTSGGYPSPSSPPTVIHSISAVSASSSVTAQAAMASPHKVDVGKAVAITCGVFFAISIATVALLTWKARRARRARRLRIIRHIGRPIPPSSSPSIHTPRSFIQAPSSPYIPSFAQYSHTHLSHGFSMRQHHSLSPPGTPVRETFPDIYFIHPPEAARRHADGGVRLNAEYSDEKAFEYGSDSLPPPYVDRRPRRERQLPVTRY